MNKNAVEVVDLFCGGGGTSAGILQAAKEKGVKVLLHAINHWDMAIATHSLNYKNVRHIQDDLERVDPLQVIPSGKLKLLTASPECTHFSNARGGKPMSRQSRATAKYILKWVRTLDVENLWLENVREFMTWGPITGCVCKNKPSTLKVSKKGKAHKHTPQCYRPIEEKKGIYFKAFVRALEREGYSLKYKVITTADYGDPTTRRRFFLIGSKSHEPQWPEPTHAENTGDMFLKPWVAAKEIIDWNIKGTSIYKRKRPLSPNTLRRIREGFLRHGGGAFVLGQQTGSVARSVEKPIPTICSEGALQLVQPFIYKMDQGGSTHSIDRPLPTLTSADCMTLVRPYLINMKHFNEHYHSIDKPIPTIVGDPRIAIVEPFIVKYYGTAVSASVKKPLPSVTGKEHLALVEPLLINVEGDTYMVDFLYRMFTVSELAAGMSFPKKYKFVGTKGDQVKQIGNAVPVLTAKALSGVFL